MSIIFDLCSNIHLFQLCLLQSTSLIFRVPWIFYIVYYRFVSVYWCITKVNLVFDQPRWSTKCCSEILKAGLLSLSGILLMTRKIMFSWWMTLVIFQWVLGAYITCKIFYSHMGFSYMFYHSINLVPTTATISRSYLLFESLSSADRSRLTLLDDAENQFELSLWTTACKSTQMIYDRNTKVSGQKMTSPDVL